MHLLVCILQWENIFVDWYGKCAFLLILLRIDCEYYLCKTVILSSTFRSCISPLILTNSSHENRKKLDMIRLGPLRLVYIKDEIVDVGIGYSVWSSYREVFLNGDNVKHGQETYCTLYRLHNFQKFVVHQGKWDQRKPLHHSRILGCYSRSSPVYFSFQTPVGTLKMPFSRK